MDVCTNQCDIMGVYTNQCDIMGVCTNQCDILNEVAVTSTSSQQREMTGCGLVSKLLGHTRVLQEHVHHKGGQDHITKSDKTTSQRVTSPHHKG
jgi:hypothetical protein